MAMRREQVEIEAPSIGGVGTVIGYGHYGRPVLLFPAEHGRAWDLEGTGMIDAVADLIEAGRAKLYTVDSYDGASWSNRSIELEERARAHDAYEAWIVERVVPAIHADLAGAQEILVAGCSMGAYHAANFALRRADLFPLALCLSGSYDPSHWHGWGHRGDAAVLPQPHGLRRAPRWRAPRLAALEGQRAARLRPGPVGGHHRRAREHPGARSAPGTQGNPT
jgi:pimeloyl-ACP methyl ester carboxylesterase